MKKYVSIIMTMVICLTILAGCGNRRTIPVVGRALEVEQSITFTGYPMDARDQTISWLVLGGYRPSQTFVSADQSPFHIWLQEKLGVNIAWRYSLPGVPGAQALNLALAQRELPFIIYANFLGNIERLIDEGVVRDLTPYMEKWSPAYWNFIHSNPDFLRAMKTDSGRFFGYGFFREGGGWNDSYIGPVINRAWLEETGLPMPVTISDWDRTIRVFNERFGAVLSFSWGRVLNEARGISGAFGAWSFANYRLFVDENNRVQLANITPEYRAQLEQFAIWWRDGLIDQDILSVNDTIARSNAMNLRKGITITSMGQLTNWINDARSRNTGADWVGLQFPTGDDGTLVHVPGGLGIGPSHAVITTAVPYHKLELVMRALDYAYTEEGHLFWNFGKQGVSWDFDENGNPVFLPLVTEDPDGMNNAIEKFSGTVWDGNAIQSTALVRMKNIPEAVAANDLWFYPNKEIVWNGGMPRGITFTEEESLRSEELIGSISTFIDEMAVRFITGQESFDNWDRYVDRVISMGAPELIAIHQAALDRFLAR